MTKSQEQRMNESLIEYYKQDPEFEIVDMFAKNIKQTWVEPALKHGYQAAMKEAEVLAEALEEAINLLQVAEHKQDDKWYHRESVVIKTLKKFKGE